MTISFSKIQSLVLWSSFFFSREGVNGFVTQILSCSCYTRRPRLENWFNLDFRFQTNMRRWESETTIAIFFDDEIKSIPLMMVVSFKVLTLPVDWLRWKFAVGWRTKRWNFECIYSRLHYGWSSFLMIFLGKPRRSKRDRVSSPRHVVVSSIRCIFNTNLEVFVSYC